MGHERVGFLPRSRRWRDIVEAIGQSIPSGEPDNLPPLAAETLECVRARYLRIHNDRGVGAAFGFLVVLTGSEKDADRGKLTGVSIDLEGNPLPVRLAASLNEWVRLNRDSAEYAEIARRAGADTITSWTYKQRRQPSLFGAADNALEIWKNGRSAEGFCEISRIFFASFTERYLRYFLEREASSRFDNIDAREQFSELLRKHLDKVSQHAFETAKITQSFAAGWYNNHVRGRCPSDSEIRDFLRLCFQKIREELLREATL